MFCHIRFYALAVAYAASELRLLRLGGSLNSASIFKVKTLY
jgi:hypothetical protein